ncbi:hypothetical protein B0H14DRAFT_67180 [Mycena olivaceomarginata]|nr:hypothetical protein B0H14DRAFT_67180 [Mycena olivaceomarginata]
MVGRLEIPHLVVRSGALCMDIAGKALVGASISGRPDMNLAVICIDFRDRAHISVSHVISPAIPQYSRPSSFFINSCLVGFLDDPVIVSWCMDADAAVQVAPQLAKSSFRAECLPLGRSLYILPWVPGSTSDGEVEVIPHPASDRQRTDTPPTSGGSSFALQYPYKEMAHIAHGMCLRAPPSPFPIGPSVLPGRMCCS